MLRNRVLFHEPVSSVFCRLRVRMSLLCSMELYHKSCSVPDKIPLDHILFWTSTVCLLKSLKIFQRLTTGQCSHFRCVVGVCVHHTNKWLILCARVCACACLRFSPELFIWSTSDLASVFLETQRSVVSGYLDEPKKKNMKSQSPFLWQSISLFDAINYDKDIFLKYPWVDTQRTS